MLSLKTLLINILIESMTRYMRKMTTKEYKETVMKHQGYQEQYRLRKHLQEKVGEKIIVIILTMIRNRNMLHY